MTQLTLAFPKQEKLQKPTISFFEDRGFRIQKSDNPELGQMIDLSDALPPIRLEFIRASDAPLLLQERVVDGAIMGSDVFAEASQDLKNGIQDSLDLQIARCRFSLAAPETIVRVLDNNINILQNLRFATSYPNILGQWLEENSIIPAKIIERAGGVESSIRMGMADVVADLVETGGTLKRNNLIEAATIFESSARLYNRAEASDRIQPFIARLEQPLLSNRVLAFA